MLNQRGKRTLTTHCNPDTLKHPLRPPDPISPPSPASPPVPALDTAHQPTHQAQHSNSPAGRYRLPAEAGPTPAGQRRNRTADLCIGGGEWRGLPERGGGVALHRPCKGTGRAGAVDEEDERGEDEEEADDDSWG